MLNCEDDDTKRARVVKSTLLWSKKLILGAERSNVVPSLLLKIKRSMSMKILVAFMCFVKKSFAFNTHFPEIPQLWAF